MIKVSSKAILIFQQVLLTLHTSKPTFNLNIYMAEYIKQEIVDLNEQAKRKSITA